MTLEDIEIQACLYEDSCHNPSIQKHFRDGAEWASRECAHDSHLVSANRRRKRAEQNLKRARKKSDHWRKATVEWQKIAYEYAKKYEATLNVNKDKDMEEILRIHSRFFALEMQRTMTATIPTRNTDPNIMYNGFLDNQGV